MKYLEGELLVMFRITFLLQIYFQLCFCLQDFIHIVRLLLAAVSIYGLKVHCHISIFQFCKFEIFKNSLASYWFPVPRF